MAAQQERRYQCRRCEDWQATRDTRQIPVCCGSPMAFRQWREVFPPTPRFGHAPAIDFRHMTPMDVPIGDGTAPVTVSSLREIRHLERESERLAADGEGQQIIFRAYSQDRSNRDLHTMGASPQRTPNLDRLTRGGTRPLFDAVDADAAEDLSMGPGADEALASALPDGGD